MSVRVSAEQLIRWAETTRQGVRIPRRYRGYPSDTADTYQDGDVAIEIGPPNGMGWEILGAFWEINANAGSVFPRIDVHRRSDGAQIVPGYLPPVNNGEVGLLYFMQGASFGPFAYAGVASGAVFPLPLNGELRDEYVRLYLMSGDAADQHRLFVYYEEFPLVI